MRKYIPSKNPCGCCCYEGWKTFSISNQFQSTKVSRKWINFTAFWTVFLPFIYMLLSTQSWILNNANIRKRTILYTYSTDLLLMTMQNLMTLPTLLECTARCDREERENPKIFKSIHLHSRHIRYGTWWGIINWMTNCFRSLIHSLALMPTVMYLSISLWCIFSINKHLTLK